MHFVKFLRTPFLTEYLWWLFLLVIVYNINLYEKNELWHSYFENILPTFQIFFSVDTYAWQLTFPVISFFLALVDVILMSLLLTLNRFHTLLCCFYCWLWTSKCRLGKSKLHNNWINWNLRLWEISIISRQTKGTKLRYVSILFKITYGMYSYQYHP